MIDNVWRDKYCTLSGWTASQKLMTVTVLPSNSGWRAIIKRAEEINIHFGLPIPIVIGSSVFHQIVCQFGFRRPNVSLYADDGLIIFGRSMGTRRILQFLHYSPLNHQQQQWTDSRAVIEQ